MDKIMEVLFDKYWETVKNLSVMKHVCECGSQHKEDEKQSWNACVSAISQEIKNIKGFTGYKDKISTRERVADFCKKIFEETHGE